MRWTIPEDIVFGGVDLKAAEDVPTRLDKKVGLIREVCFHEAYRPIQRPGAVV